MNRYLLIIYTKLGNVDRRERLLFFLNRRVKSDQSVHPAKIESSILSFQRRLIIELVAQQPVFVGKNTYILTLSYPLLVPNLRVPASSSKML